MLIAGEWRLGDDGVTRPAVQAKVQAADGTFLVAIFLIDSCADRTVFSADLLSKLQIAPAGSPAGLALQGVGGKSAFVLVKTVIEFTRDEKDEVPIPGEGYGFAVLKAAQALGDLEALRRANRRVARLHLRGRTPTAIEKVTGMVKRALK